MSSKISRRSGKGAFYAFTEYLLLRCIETLLRLLPLKVAYWLSETLVSLTYLLIRKYRSRTKANIALAYGRDLEARELRQLYRDSLRYHAWFIADMLLAPFLMKQKAHANAVDWSDVAKQFQKNGIPESHGALLVSSHQGAPDIVTLSLGKAGFTVAAIARPLDNLWLNRHSANIRKGFHRIEIPKNGGLRPAYRHLKNRAIVGIQIDQDAGSSGVFVPYFNRLASTHRGAATLSLMTKAPTFMLFCIRIEERSFQFKLFIKPIELRQYASYGDANIERLTAKMTRCIEEMARSYPEQVMWAHRRWKTRPKSGSLNAYKQMGMEAGLPVLENTEAPRN